MGPILKVLGTCVWLLVSSNTAYASETDQFLALFNEPSDSTEKLNKRFNHKIQEALYEINDKKKGSEYSCRRLTGKVMWKFRFVLMHKIARWAQKGNVSIIPGLEVGNGKYMDSSIHNNGKKFNTKTIVPLARTIRVGGVNLGTDKLGHFVSMGHKYFKRYLKLTGEGKSDAEALDEIIQYGIATEKGMIGEKVSGVRSYADLEANYQGLLFIKTLCHDENPRIVLEDGKWEFKRPLDISEYVNPNWDESFNNSTYSEKKWVMVKKNLQNYCEDLTEEGVLQRQTPYAPFVQSQNMNLIYQAENEGVLPPQSEFNLKAACLAN